MRVYPIKFGENRKRCRLATFAVALKGITFNSEKLKNQVYLPPQTSHPSSTLRSQFHSFRGHTYKQVLRWALLFSSTHWWSLLPPSLFVLGPSLKGILFGLKSQCLRWVGGTLLASNITQVAGISGWNGSYGSMGPEGHIWGLDLVIRATPGAQWVQNDRLIEVSFSLKSQFLRWGVFLASNVTKVADSFGWNG